jgi:hypothetical protein
MAEYKSFGQFTKALEKATKKMVTTKRSTIASAINRELTGYRKEIVETLMSKTGLKRKTLNDRMVITRANPKEQTIEGKITAIYGRKIYMTDYPIESVVARGNRKTIRLTSPIYRKNMRTGFMSRDGKKLYLRAGDGSSGKIRSVYGRTVPRLFTEGKIKETYEPSLVNRIKTIIISIFSYNIYK